MRIQLPTGKTATVDTAWWLGLSDDEQQRFYEGDHGSEIDPMEIAIPNGKDLPETETENARPPLFTEGTLRHGED